MDFLRCALAVVFLLSGPSDTSRSLKSLNFTKVCTQIIVPFPLVLQNDFLFNISQIFCSCWLTNVHNNHHYQSAFCGNKTPKPEPGSQFTVMLNSEVVEAFLPFGKEDEREQINHRCGYWKHIKTPRQSLCHLFTFYCTSSSTLTACFSKAVLLKVIGCHYFLLRVYENLTDKEDFRSLGNECSHSSEELTVPNT